MDVEMKSTDSSEDKIINHTVGLMQKKKGPSDPNKRLPPAKRDIKDVCAFAADDFVYTKPLGEGAFGKVRKCEYEIK